MNICLLSYRGNPYSGGQGIYLKHLAEGLAESGHNIHVLVGPPYPDEMKDVKVHRIESKSYYGRETAELINSSDPLDIFHPINFYQYLHTRLGAFSEISAFSYRAYFLFKKLHARERFDLVHDNQSLGFGLLLMKTLGVPLVSTIHHPLSVDLQNVLSWLFSFKKKVKSIMFYPLLMQSFVSRRLDHIITVSESSKKRIERDFGVREKKQTVVYNGVDRSIFRQEKGVERERNRVLFVGNIEDRNKGGFNLLKALSLMDKKIKLTVVDGGAPHRKLTSQILEKLKMTGRVNFTGKVNNSELVRIYSTASLAVVPSVFEGFGFPAAEAMSCGTPLITSDGGALPEVTGDAGFVVPSGDHTALSAKIAEVLENPDLMEKMSRAGVKRVKENFTWEKAVSEVVEVYRKVVSLYL
jgi:glycosyltransferase involved in cell wall biosynthesis